MPDDDLRGRFLWYDLFTTEPDAAVEFYTAVTGWGTETWDGAGKPYTMWTGGGGPLGGVTALPPQAAASGAPPHWIAYVGVADTDAAVARAQELGGSLLYGPEDIPTVGRFAMLRDPQGAAFSVFTPAHPMPAPEGPPPPGHFSWHELATTDVADALAFYGDLFGWEKQETHDMGEMGIYQIYGRGGVPLGGIYVRPPEIPVSAWIFYVRTTALDAAAARAAELGGRVIAGPMEVPGGDRIAICHDPQGGVFALHESAS